MLIDMVTNRHSFNRDGNNRTYSSSLDGVNQDMLAIYLIR